MAVYAQVSDVEDRLGTSIEDDKLAQVETLLGDAEAVLTATVGDLPARVLAGRTSADNIARVAANMVCRVLRNPLGVRQETTGPFSYSVDTAVASGKLLVTRDERRLLGLRRPAGSLPMADAALARPLRRPVFLDEPVVAIPALVVTPAEPAVVVVREFDVPASFAGSDSSAIAGQAPFAGTVTKVEYIPLNSMTGAVTNNRTLSLVNKGQSGTGTTVVASVTFAAGTNAVANDELALTLAAAPSDVVAAGDTLLWRSVHNGSGLSDPGGLARVVFTEA